MAEEKRGFWTFKRDTSRAFDGILILPFFIAGIDSTFGFFYYFIAAGKGASKEALRSLMSYGAGLPHWAADRMGLLALFIPLAVWYLPIWRFNRSHDPSLKETVKRRIATAYPALFALFAMVLCIKVATHVYVFRQVLTARPFFLLHLPAMVLSAAVGLCFSLVLLDNSLVGVGGLMARLYSREELYSSRAGANISFVVKVALLLLSTAVVPMLMLYAYLRMGLGLVGEPLIPVHNLLINSLMPMLIGFTFILGGLQRPLDGLAEKMQRLASGDFDVKTRVYFNDEVAHLKASFNRMADQLKERELLRETFGKYVSVEVARKLMSSGRLDLGGEELEATVLFCDIRNFTPMSERMTPRQVVEFLNRYFSYVTRPIMENHGVINKFIGDAVMAIFAPPLGSEDHAGDALRAALGMREALARFNAEAPLPEPVRFGVGIQTGTLVAGNVGTMSRLEYTVIGDTVNTASRLQSVTKDVGVDILVSEKVYGRAKDAVPGLSFRSVGPVPLKGKAEPMQLYAVV